jgi:hypothetical protein
VCIGVQQAYDRTNYTVMCVLVVSKVVHNAVYEVCIVFCSVIM